MPALLLRFLVLAALAATVRAQPAEAPILPLDEIQPGQRGQVWTVFQGTEPEPFEVEVTGVLRNSLGPGKSLIVCRLTDPRVQSMGAVAGMSGSPLYLGGRLAGALSYQIQRFETVRHAGFTPAADLGEVRERAARPAPTLVRSEAAPPAIGGDWQPLQPAFSLGGLSPAVQALFAERFAALGIPVGALAGSTQGGDAAQPATAEQRPAGPGTKSSRLRAGSALAVALATGDVTLAATGTVSRVDGNAVTAFGHPMLSLGEVDLPLCQADIVTILPSQMSSVKIANTGAVIGTITQDRLSAVSGTLGPGPRMTEVEVTVRNTHGANRLLRFAVVRHAQLTPMIVAAGLTQAIMASNDAGALAGFRLSSRLQFEGARKLEVQSLYAGPQGFAQGLAEFIQGLSGNLQNPYARTFPERVTFTVEPLARNPAVTVELFQAARSVVRPGQVVPVTLGWRDWQGEAHREVIELTIDPAWAGRQLELVLAPGRAMDELTGRPRMITAAELRGFDAYLAAMADSRAADGLYVAVVERTTVLGDQTIATPEPPGSIERIARAADEQRFRRREALLPLWERQRLPGQLANVVIRRPLQVTD